MYLKQQIENYLISKKQDALILLSEMVSFNSVYGNECGIQEYLYDYCIKKELDIHKDYMSERLKESPYYTKTKEEILHRDRYNLIGSIKGNGTGKSLILNAHTDVVPATAEWPNAFLGEIKDNIVIGRGACDDKGGVLSIILAVEALKYFGVKLDGDVDYQFVIEEEVGGNGSLSLIEKGYRSNCAIVIEPTELYQCPAGRGAFWFEILVPGKSVHMAEINSGISAIDNAIEVIGILKEYEKKMVKEYGDHFLFRWHERPSQINVGILNSGDIPPMVPESAVIEGGVGFLPTRKMKDVMEEMSDYISRNINEWMRDKIVINYNKLQNEAYEEDISEECIKIMKNCLIDQQLNGEPRGFIASCDARLFHYAGKMPCITFGPGSIKDAHSSHESCNVDDIIKAACVITDFVLNWCID